MVPAQTPIPVTVVVPCYNEEDALPHLSIALDRMCARLRPRYEPAFVFVDDGSTDRTPVLLQSIFGSRDHCQIVHFAENKGIAAALLAGIRHSRDEVVCTIDSDCTYDPSELENMLPLLNGNVDVVTASPYHSLGRVLDVPPWRLRLSKTASALYRIVLRQKLATYTSCFRVYRRSSVVDLTLSNQRFAGVAEILGRLDLQGSRIVEYPATLRVRSSGRSKMRLLRTILSQLAVLSRLACIRCFRPAGKPIQYVITSNTVTSDTPPQRHVPSELSTAREADFLNIGQGHEHATDN